MARPVKESKDKYKNNISETSYKNGVNAVTENPASKAIKEKDRFEKNTLAGKEKLIKNLSEIPLADWQKATKDSWDKLETKVIQAVDSGKYPSGKVLEAGKAAHVVVKDMPKGTYSQSYDRYLAAKQAIINTYKK